MLRCMQEPRAFWQQIHGLFNPAIPAQHDNWRADRPYSPRKAIVHALQRPIGSTRFLLMGTTGTGKTTELLAIGEALTRSHLVVYLDLWAHFEAIRDPAALQRLQAWEVVTLTGLALLRAAQERFGHKWSPTALKTFKQALASLTSDRTSPHAEIDLFQLASNVATLVGGVVGGPVGAGLTALTGLAGDAGSWFLRLGEREQPPTSESDQRVHHLLDAVNLLLTEIQGGLARKVAVLIDGLDRVTDLDTTRRLFVESPLLGSLESTTIVIGPIRHKLMAAQVYRFTTKILANAPVLDVTDPQTPAARGLDFLHDVLRRRVTHIVPAQGLASALDAFPRPLLDRLSQYSGGRLRDFIRLIGMVAEQAYDEDLSVITREIVDRCIDERRRVLEAGVTRDDADVLIQVMNDAQHLPPDSERIDTLIATDRLLPFPNESEWYYPHPLLTLRLLAKRG